MSTTADHSVNAHMEQAESQLKENNPHTTDDGETVKVVTVYHDALGVWFESGPKEGRYDTIPKDSVQID